MSKGIPKFMINYVHGGCSPVTVYTAKRDGRFIARCHSVPGMVVVGENFDDTVQKATQAHLGFCRKGIWN